MSEHEAESQILELKAELEPGISADALSCSDGTDVHDVKWRIYGEIAECIKCGMTFRWEQKPTGAPT